MNIKGDDMVIGVSKVIKDSDSVAIICEADKKIRCLHLISMNFQNWTRVEELF